MLRTNYSSTQTNVSVPCSWERDIVYVQYALWMQYQALGQCMYWDDGDHSTRKVCVCSVGGEGVSLHIHAPVVQLTFPFLLQIGWFPSTYVEEEGV